MASTGFNVRKGLAGMYLLRDRNLESVLPKRKYEQNLLISAETSITNPSVERAIYSLPKKFETNVYYRFRILNSDFDNFYNNIRFEYEDNGQNKTIKYIVIGADSALRQTPVTNVEKTSLASAERIDILIKFPSTLPEGKVVFVKCEKDPPSSNETGDDYLNNTLIRLIMGPQSTDQSAINYQPPSTFNVPWTDLSQI